MLQDVRFALRSLAKSPTFTAAVVLILVIGIGSTVALVSVVQAVLLEPLPYPEPDRLMVLWAEWPPREIRLRRLPAPWRTLRSGSSGLSRRESP